jgi:hypothetical protein
VRNAYRVLDGNLREADHSGDLSADGKIDFKEFGRVCAGPVCRKMQSHDEHV